MRGNRSAWPPLHRLDAAPGTLYAHFYGIDAHRSLHLLPLLFGHMLLRRSNLYQAEIENRLFSL